MAFQSAFPFPGKSHIFQCFLSHTGKFPSTHQLLVCTRLWNLCHRPATGRKPSAGSGAARLQAFHLSTLSGMIFRVHNIWCFSPQKKSFHFHSGSLGAARAFPDPKCVPAAKKWKDFSGRSINVPFFLPLSTNVAHWVFPPGLPVLLYTPSLCRKTGGTVRNHLPFPRLFLIFRMRHFLFFQQNMREKSFHHGKIHSIEIRKTIPSFRKHYSTCSEKRFHFSRKTVPLLRSKTPAGVRLLRVLNN